MSAYGRDGSCTIAAVVAWVGRCGVRRRRGRCGTRRRGCCVACLLAPRGPQLESVGASSRHRCLCRGRYCRNHGVGAGSTGCRVCKTCRGGQTAQMRQVSVVRIQLARLTRAGSRLIGRTSRMPELYIARQQTTCCIYVLTCWVTHDAWGPSVKCGSQLPPCPWTLICSLSWRSTGDGNVLLGAHRQFQIIGPGGLGRGMLWMCCRPFASDLVSHGRLSQGIATFAIRNHPHR